MTANTLPDDSFLDNLFIHHINCIYNGKQFLKKNLDHLISLAASKKLQLGMHEFASDVEKQISRLEEVYDLTGNTPGEHVCNPIKALIQDEFCLDKDQTVSALNDMDIILYVQLIEHVNITSFRMLLTVAKQLRNTQVSQLLMENFDESTDNDRLFMAIAEEYITGE